MLFRSVLFFDTHCAAPFYPGSGHLDEVGAGLGEGYTINVPLPETTGDIAAEKRFVKSCFLPPSGLNPILFWSRPALIRTITIWP